MASLKNEVPLLLNLAPGIFIFMKSFVFSDENYLISSVLSVLSSYITCIAQIFRINCI